MARAASIGVTDASADLGGIEVIETNFSSIHQQSPYRLFCYGASQLRVVRTNHGPNISAISPKTSNGEPANTLGLFFIGPATSGSGP